MTVIYYMSIDMADKPWIGDRRLTEYLFEHNYFTVRKTLHSLVQYYRVRNF
jgi:hypothetical protein